MDFELCVHVQNILIQQGTVERMPAQLHAIHQSWVTTTQCGVLVCSQCLIRRVNFSFPSCVNELWYYRQNIGTLEILCGVVHYRVFLYEVTELGITVCFFMKSQNLKQLHFMEKPHQHFRCKWRFLYTGTYFLLWFLDITCLNTVLFGICVCVCACHEYRLIASKYNTGIYRTILYKAALRL